MYNFWLIIRKKYLEKQTFRGIFFGMITSKKNTSKNFDTNLKSLTPENFDLKNQDRPMLRIIVLVYH